MKTNTAAKFSQVVAALAPRSLAEIRSTVNANVAARRPAYSGLERFEISEFNRAAMFGDEDESLPSQDEWSRAVD